MIFFYFDNQYCIKMEQLPQCLWITILKYIDPIQYKQCGYVNRKWNEGISHPEIHRWVYNYLDYYMKGFEIESEEEDNRDDCGVYCHVYFLKNGMVLDSEEYEEMYQQQIENIQYNFSRYHHSSSSLLFKNIS